jgi:hypothetical protein
MTAVSIRRLGLTASAAFLALFLLQQVAGDGKRDARGNGLFPDFVSYYAVSQLMAEGRTDLVYQQAEVVRRGRQILGLDDPEQNYLFLYPPGVLPLLKPLVWVPYPLLAWTFFGLNLVLGWWLAHAIPRWWGWEENKSGAVAALFLCSLPFLRTVWFGQNTLILLAMVFLALRAWKARQFMVCGLWCAAACYKPQLLSGLLLAGLICGGWRWALGFGLGLGAWFGLSCLVGLQRWPEWLATVRSLSGSQENVLWKHSLADTLRLWGMPGPEAMGLGLILLILGSSVVAWTLFQCRHQSATRLEPLICMAVVGGLTLSPRVYQYDLVLVYPFLLPALDFDLAKSRLWLMGLGLALLLSDAFQMIRLPFVTVLLIWLCVRLWRKAKSDPQGR